MVSESQQAVNDQTDGLALQVAEFVRLAGLALQVAETVRLAGLAGCLSLAIDH
jgi:hypothetical protein